MDRSLDINSEKRRLKNNIFILRQKKYRFKQLAVNGTETKEYYQNLLSRLSTAKSQFMSFYYDYEDCKRDGQSQTNGIEHEQLKGLHRELKEAYKETADFLGHLHQAVKDKAEAAPEQMSNKPNGGSFLKEEIEGLLVEIEDKIRDKISKWKRRDDLIECAGFVQNLYDRKYLVNGKHNRKICKTFAKKRYKVDLGSQFTSSKNDARNYNKKKFDKYFKN